MRAVDKNVNLPGVSPGKGRVWLWLTLNLKQSASHQDQRLDIGERGGRSRPVRRKCCVFVIRPQNNIDIVIIPARGFW